MVFAHHFSSRTDCPLAEAHGRLIAVGGIEVPLATHDGFIWPLPRQHMCDPAAIKVRLAEDIIAIWRANDGHLADGDLIRLGWAVDDNDTRVLAWRLRRLLADAARLAADARPDLIGEACRSLTYRHLKRAA